MDVSNIARLRGRVEALQSFPRLSASFDEAAATISYHDAERSGGTFSIINSPQVGILGVGAELGL